MSIRNRLNRFVKEQLKKARKRAHRRAGITAEFPRSNRRRVGKRRGLDGTMDGPFRSSRVNG